MFVTYVLHTLFIGALISWTLYILYKNDEISKSTKILSRAFRNLTTHAKHHFEKEVYLKMTVIGREIKIIKAHTKHENMQSQSFIQS